MPSELPYIACKGALHQLTPSLAAHLMPRGITVNCVDPGPNDTGYADAETRAAVAARNPGGRWSSPVAWALLGPAGWLSGVIGALVGIAVGIGSVLARRRRGT